MIPFKKLNFKHQLSFNSCYQKELIVRYGDEQNGIFNGIEYWTIQSNYYYDQVRKILPVVDQNFTLYWMNITAKTITAHTDSGQKAVINFYLNTNNCTTQFFSIDHSTVQSTIKWQQQKGGQVFTSGIIPSYKFVADIGDIYILDVATPHAVFCDSCQMPRSALCFGTNLYTFAELCEVLNDY